jgi:hypothetical protein
VCRAISILKQRIAAELYEQYQLETRASHRNQDAAEEVLFDFADRKHEPRLPVIVAGRMYICLWGNRGDKGSRVPKTGWCRQESLDAGKWQWLKPEPVVIPATFGLEKGIWFPIREGVEGVFVRDEANRPRVYMLTQAASTYYSNMTKHDRMPILVGETI